MEIVNLETVANIIFKQTIYRSEEHFEDWLHPDKPYEFRCPHCSTTSVMLNRLHDSKRQWEVKNKIDLISLNQNGGFDENKVNKYHYSYPEYFFAIDCSNCKKSYLIVLGENEQWPGGDVIKLKVIFEVECINIFKDD